jgi:hypothetical protein
LALHVNKNQTTGLFAHLNQNISEEPEILVAAGSFWRLLVATVSCWLFMVAKSRYKLLIYMDFRRFQGELISGNVFRRKT